MSLACSQATAAESLGFVLTAWNTAMYESLFMDECPEGPAAGNWEIWATTVSPEKRRSYGPMEISAMQHIYHRGENGEDVCVKPTTFEDPPLRIIEGKYSYGINLDDNVDGTATATTCPHENFVGLNGEQGIDNQMYRLLGCLPAWRKSGHIENNANAHRKATGLGMILIEVTDVDDRTNDDDVKVGFYRGVGSFSLDSNGAVLPFATYGVDQEDGVPRYGDVAKGRIVDGVLETMPADIHLPHYGNWQYLRQLIQDMRLRMPLPGEDGRADGMIYGYYGVDQLYDHIRGNALPFSVRHKFSCPGIYTAAHELADGHPDGETGECTTLSSAFRFQAVAAFVDHAAGEQVSQVSRESP